MVNHSANVPSDGPLHLDDEAVAKWSPRRPNQPSGLLVWVRYRDPSCATRVVPTLAPVTRPHGVLLTWGAALQEVFIGSEDAYWHEAFILTAPNHTALRSMLTSVAYSRASLSLADTVTDTQVMGIRPVEIPAVARGALGLFRATGPLYRRLHRPPAELGGLEMPGGVNPTHAQLSAMRETRRRGSVAMVNLLSFRERACYGSDGSVFQRSGRDAYQRYGQVAVRGVSLLGGRVVLIARVRAMLRAAQAPDTEGPWDELAIVEYPSRQRFVDLAGTPGYIAATHHRSAGLSRTTLVVSEPWDAYRLVRS